MSAFIPINSLAPQGNSIQQVNFIGINPTVNPIPITPTINPIPITPTINPVPITTIIPIVQIKSESSLFSNNSISSLDNSNFTFSKQDNSNIIQFNNTNTSVILFSGNTNDKKYIKYLKVISDIAPSIINVNFYICINSEIIKNFKDDISLILFKNGNIYSIYDDIIDFSNILTFCLS
jgi:hypothetical protein